MLKAKSSNTNKLLDKSSDFLISMSHAPKVGESIHWFQMIPATIFASIIIMVTRMAFYERPMEQFFWTNATNQLSDFFSYNKMITIIFCAVFALVLLLYRVFCQTFYVKRNFVIIPLVIYSLLVILSYAFSDYKLFALWGWNERFEGTLVLLAYMVMLFYVINSVNSEKNVKWIVYPVIASSAMLGLLGVSQAIDHDFFQTVIGKKLITPSWFWNQLDTLNFTFKNKEIYQTVYNINYVSFYLTLLIPLLGMLFIRSFLAGKEEATWKKILWASLFTLLIFNLIGSASSGGFLGMFVVVLVAIIVLNKKILSWWKPIIILVVLTIVMAGATFDRWAPELLNSINSATITEKSNSQPNIADVTDLVPKSVIDYFDTKDYTISLGVNGEEMTITTFPDSPEYIQLLDKEGTAIAAKPISDDTNVLKLQDERFNMINISPVLDDSGNHYLILIIDQNKWPFLISDNGVKYLNQLNKLVDLDKIPFTGFKNNMDFGSGRGFIWSRSIPMIKDTLLIGHGADTFCLYFPHNDYAGKYNWAGFESLNLIIDKPHNMFLGIAINTGLMSLLSLFAIWLVYIIQSIKIFWFSKLQSFYEFVGVGIFLGICGFLVSGAVNDTSVSVMPMFYGLLGTGISINQIINKNHNQAS